MILGFGSTEQRFVDAEEAAFKDFARHQYLECACSYVTDELVGGVRKWIEKRAADYHKQSDEYKDAAEHPDRYSYYQPTVLHDASHIIVIFRHSHINRRHALSPDGWALMQTEHLACFSSTRDT